MSSIISVILLVSLAISRPLQQESTGGCYYTRGDPDWPTIATWQSLNASVAGKLIATTPEAQVCHIPDYDATQCNSLKLQWVQPQTQADSPSGIQSPYFQNESCIPFTSTSTPCTLGNLVDYSIDVRSSEDVIQALQFSRDNNIRIVIKNTGHDFLGRSTGSSSLALWMHNLKDTTFLPNYTSESYSGHALRLAAGVQAFDAINAADASGVRVVTGSCPTVSCGGGYTQGGGHSPLSSVYGLSADNVLEWDVVLANGSEIVASPSQNSDLYWALSGGGGSFAVLVSMTIKAFPEDNSIGGANITIAADAVSEDDFWNAVSLWLQLQPELAEAGGGLGYFIDPQTKFWVQFAAFPGMTSNQVNQLLKPFADGLERLDIPFSMNISSFTSFKQLYAHYIGLPYGDEPINSIQDSRLISRSIVDHNLPALINVLKTISGDPRFGLLGVTVNVTQQESNYNSVLPAWRQTSLQIEIDGPCNYSLPWDTNMLMQQDLIDTYMPMLGEVTGDAGAYVNEANFAHTNWQTDFYGPNYDRLLQVKRSYDPAGIFYANKAVGSDAWDLQTEGRLCKTS